MDANQRCKEILKGRQTPDGVIRGCSGKIPTLVVFDPSPAIQHASIRMCETLCGEASNACKHTV